MNAYVLLLLVAALGVTCALPPFAVLPDVPELVTANAAHANLGEFVRLWSNTLLNDGQGDEPTRRINFEPKTIVAPNDFQLLNVVPQHTLNPLLDRNESHADLRREFLLDHILLDPVQLDDPALFSEDGITSMTFSGKDLVFRFDMEQGLVANGVSVTSAMSLQDGTQLFTLDGVLFDAKQRVRQASQGPDAATRSSDIDSPLGPPLDIDGEDIHRKIPQPPAPPSSDERNVVTPAAGATLQPPRHISPPALPPGVTVRPPAPPPATSRQADQNTRKVVGPPAPPPFSTGKSLFTQETAKNSPAVKQSTSTVIRGKLISAITSLGEFARIYNVSVQNEGLKPNHDQSAQTDVPQSRKLRQQQFNGNSLAGSAFQSIDLSPNLLHQVTSENNLLSEHVSSKNQMGVPLPAFSPSSAPLTTHQVGVPLADLTPSIAPVTTHQVGVHLPGSTPIGAPLTANQAKGVDLPAFTSSSMPLTAHQAEGVHLPAFTPHAAPLTSQHAEGAPLPGLAPSAAPLTTQNNFFVFAEETDTNSIKDLLEDKLEIDDFDDDLGSIDEIMLAEDLTACMEMLRDTGLLDQLLDDNSGTFLLLAPSNEALSSLTTVELTKLKLGQEFGYHIIPLGDMPAPEVTNDSTFTTLLGQPVRFNLYGGKVFVNGKGLTKGDIRVPRGTIQVVDGVLRPPVGDLQSVLQAVDAPVTRTATLLAMHGRPLVPDTPMTVFAPLDASITSKGFSWPDLLENSEMAGRLLEGHTVTGSWYTKGLELQRTLMTTGGVNITFRNMGDGTITANGVPLLMSDLSASNGVAHIVADLIPNADLGTHPNQIKTQLFDFIQEEGIHASQNSFNRGNFGPEVPETPSVKSVQRPNVEQSVVNIETGSTFDGSVPPLTALYQTPLQESFDFNQVLAQTGQKPHGQPEETSDTTGYDLVSPSLGLQSHRQESHLSTEDVSGVQTHDEEVEQDSAILPGSLPTSIGIGNDQLSPSHITEADVVTHERPHEAVDQVEKIASDYETNVQTDITDTSIDFADTDLLIPVRGINHQDSELYGGTQVTHSPTIISDLDQRPPDAFESTAQHFAGSFDINDTKKPAQEIPQSTLERDSKPSYLTLYGTPVQSNVERRDPFSSAQPSQTSQLGAQSTNIAEKTLLSNSFVPIPKTVEGVNNPFDLSNIDSFKNFNKRKAIESFSVSANGNKDHDTFFVITKSNINLEDIISDLDDNIKKDIHILDTPSIFFNSSIAELALKRPLPQGLFDQIRASLNAKNMTIEILKSANKTPNLVPVSEKEKNTEPAIITEPVIKTTNIKNNARILNEESKEESNFINNNIIKNKINFEVPHEIIVTFKNITINSNSQANLTQGNLLTKPSLMGKNINDNTRRVEEQIVQHVRHQVHPNQTGQVQKHHSLPVKDASQNVLQRSSEQLQHAFVVQLERGSNVDPSNLKSQSNLNKVLLEKNNSLPSTIESSPRNSQEISNHAVIAKNRNREQFPNRNLPESPKRLQPAITGLTNILPIQNKIKSAPEANFSVGIITTPQTDTIENEHLFDSEIENFSLNDLTTVEAITEQEVTEEPTDSSVFIDTTEVNQPTSRPLPSFSTHASPKIGVSLPIFATKSHIKSNRTMKSITQTSNITSASHVFPNSVTTGATIGKPLPSVTTDVHISTVKPVSLVSMEITNVNPGRPLLLLENNASKSTGRPLPLLTAELNDVTTARTLNSFTTENSDITTENPLLLLSTTTDVESFDSFDIHLPKQITNFKAKSHDRTLEKDLLQEDSTLSSSHEEEMNVIEFLRSENLTAFADMLEATGLNRDMIRGGPWTIFAPSNEGIEIVRLSGGLDLSMKDLRHLAAYHVVPGVLTRDRFVDRSRLPTLYAGFSLFMEVNELHQWSVGGGLVTGFSTTRSGPSTWVIHEVDRVLYAPHGSLFTTISLAPSLTRFTDLIMADGDIQQMLQGRSPVTVFAPSNAALSRIRPDVRPSSAWIMSHIAEGFHYSVCFPRNDSIVTLAGTDISSSTNASNGVVSINGIPASYLDITAANGVLHVLDDLIVNT